MWHTRITDTSRQPRPEMCDVIPANADGRSALREPLPSLSARFPLPEPHPDYHAVLASLHAKRLAQQASRRRMSVSRRHSGGELEGDAADAHAQRRRTESPICGNSPKTPCNGVAPPHNLAQQDGKAAESLSHIYSFMQNGHLNMTANNKIETQQRVAAALSSLAPPKTVSRPPPPPQMTVMHHPFASSYAAAPPSTSVASSNALPKRASTGLLSASSLAEMGLLRAATIHATQEHEVTSSRYATAADPRGYIPVYEYTVNGSAILIDADNSYVLLTSVCKAIGPFRSDIVRHVESVPELECLCRKIRGGFLKIQGTWVPYKLAYEICRRVAWQIRSHLVPIFGYDFPSRCLAPLDSGYGDLRILTTTRRVRRSPGVTVAVLPTSQTGEQSQTKSPPPNSTFQRSAALAAMAQQQQHPQTLHSSPAQQLVTSTATSAPSSNGRVAKVDPMNSLSSCARSYLSSQVDSSQGRLTSTQEETAGQQQKAQQQQMPQQSLPPSSHSVVAAQQGHPHQHGYPQHSTPQPQPQPQRRPTPSPAHYQPKPLQPASHYHPYAVRSKLASLANRPAPGMWSAGPPPMTTSIFSMLDERNARSSGPMRTNPVHRP